MFYNILALFFSPRSDVGSLDSLSLSLSPSLLSFCLMFMTNSDSPLLCLVVTTPSFYFLFENTRYKYSYKIIKNISPFHPSLLSSFPPPPRSSELTLWFSSSSSWGDNIDTHIDFEEHPFLDDQEEEEEEQRDTGGSQGVGGSSSSSSSE